MKIRKKILILSIIFGLILIISVLFYYFYFLAQPKYLTDIAELYSFFTDYMKDEIGLRLQLLGCEPKKYYYDNSNFCFVCGSISPCFGYGWIDREEGMKMNPGGFPYIAGAEELEVQIADFCKDGLASEFNCKKINKDSLECEKLKFVATNKDGVFKCEEVKLILKEEIELKNFADDFCRLKEEELGETKESSVACGEYLIGLIENREIIIGIILEEG